MNYTMVYMNEHGYFRRQRSSAAMVTLRSGANGVQLKLLARCVLTIPFLDDEFLNMEGLGPFACGHWMETRHKEWREHERQGHPSLHHDQHTAGCLVVR
jgi:hypothetical protein